MTVCHKMHKLALKKKLEMPCFYLVKNDFGLFCLENEIISSNKVLLHQRVKRPAVLISTCLQCSHCARLGLELGLVENARHHDMCCAHLLYETFY